MSRLDADSTYWHFLGGLVVFGFGMALTSTPATTAIVTSLPRAKQGVASAVNDVSRELGSALGIAILGSLFNSGYRAAVSHGDRRRCPPRPPMPSRSRPAPASRWPSHLGAGGQPLADAVSDAFAAGLGTTP